MPTSSVFIELMSCALYRMIYKCAKKKFGKKGLIVPNVKLFAKNVFSVFGVFDAFLFLT